MREEADVAREAPGSSIRWMTGCPFAYSQWPFTLNGGRGPSLRPMMAQRKRRADSGSSVTIVAWPSFMARGWLVVYAAVRCPLRRSGANQSNKSQTGALRECCDAVTLAARPRRCGSEEPALCKSSDFPRVEVVRQAGWSHCCLLVRRYRRCRAIASKYF